MVAIIPVSTDHYDDIVDIYNQAIQAGSQTADLAPIILKDKLEWLDQHTGEHYAIYVATENSKVLGYIAISPYRNGRAAFHKTAEVSYYLSSNSQGKGIGTRLLEHAIKSCPQLGIDCLIAILLSCNEDSIALLRKFNFEKWGLMPNAAAIRSIRVDHLYYGKHLS